MVFAFAALDLSQAWNLCQFLQPVGDRVDFCRVADHALAQEQADHLLAEAANVHGAARGEVLDGALDDGRTVAVVAVEVGVVVFARDAGAAPGALADVDDASVAAAVLIGAAEFAAGGAGTDCGHLPFGRVLGSAFQHRSHDLGDHFAGAADDDGVALADVLAADVVEVVQGGVGDLKHRPTRTGLSLA